MRRLGAGAALALGLVVGLYSQWPSFGRPYVINNDARQHTYWMQQWADPELYAGDPITEYAKAYQPWGYVAVYRALSPVVAPLTLGKLLPSMLLGLTALLFFLLGERLGGPWAGAISAVWVTVTPIVLHKMAGGHARAFAIPLLAAFLLALLRRSRWGVVAVLVVQSLFYPMVLLISLGAGGLSLLRRGEGRWRLDRGLAVALLAGGLLGGALVMARQARTEAVLGPLATAEDLRGKPEAGPSGFFPLDPGPRALSTVRREVRQVFTLLPSPVLRPRLPVGSPWRHAEPWLVLLLAAILALGWRWGLPPAVPSVLVAGIGLWVLADRLLLRLFIPARYLQYPLRVVGVLAFAWLAARLLGLLPAAWQRLAGGAVLLALLAHVPALSGVGLENHGGARALFEYLRTTPKNTLVAAHPYLADDIQIFAERKVLVDFEHVQPFYPQFWNAMKGRTSDLFAAYYAEDLETVCGFLARYGIDDLVIDGRHFAAAFLRSRRLYPEPFRSEILGSIGHRRRFVLDGLPPTAPVFRRGPLQVVTPASLGCLPLAPSPAAGPGEAPPGS